MSTWSYRPELDGLRCVAVYLVLLFHAGLTWAGGGFVGVDLFFVLSGFLVTQVILAEIDERGTFSLGRFYSRRVRRLLPAAVLVILVTALVQVLVASLPQRVGQLDDGRAALLYVANWQFIADSRDYFAADSSTSPFLHFWSLSIEEQFYVGFPLLLLLALRVSRTPVRLLTAAMTFVLVVSLSLQVWHAQSGDPTYAYYATDTRLYQLAAGVLMGIGVRALNRAVPGKTTERSAGAVALTGLVVVVVLGTGIVDVSPSLRGILATAAAGLAIGGLFDRPRTLVARLLALPLPRYLGQISYGTYLWHWPVLLLAKESLDVGAGVIALIGATVATGLAALSHQVLEAPIRRTSALDRFRWPVVSMGVAVSLVAATLVLPSVLDSPRRPAVSANADTGVALGRLGAAGERLDGPVPAGIDLAAALADIPKRQPICTPTAVDACEVVPGDGPHILLVGDSQAQMFQAAFASMAREHGYRLSLSVLKACTWQMGLRNELSNDSDQEECRNARKTLYTEVLPRMDVDLVVAISMSRSDERWDEDLVADGDAPDGETLVQRQYRTAQETAAAIRAAGARLVLVKSLMGTEGYDLDGWDPLDCLARAKTLGDCAVTPPLVKPALDGLYDAIATTTDGVATVDLNPVLCPDAPLCAPVIDDTVVWKDPDHVTGTFLDERSEDIRSRLVATGLID